MEGNHRAEYTRGFLPTIDRPFHTQFITFRLGDSLPQSILASWREELKEKKIQEAKRELLQKTSKYLDAGYGSCLLREPEVAIEVINVLTARDGVDYDLHAWVVMPNHVHVLMTQGDRENLATIVHAWKSTSAHRINKGLGRSGKVWGREYFDRSLRDKDRIQDVINYIEWNPVKAGLCELPKDWPFSSWQESN